MSRHIAFLSLPHPPHVNPTLSIVSVFIRRGYQVTYVTSERFRDRLADLGATVITCQSYDPKDLHHPDGAQWFLGYKKVIKRMFELSVNIFEIALPVLEERPPDVLIYDGAIITGPALADRLKIPQIRTTPMFALDPKCFEHQVTHEKYREELIAARVIFTEFAKSFDPTFLSPTPDESGFTVHLIPQVIQPDGNVFGDGYFYAGRCAGEQPFFSAWRPSCDCERPLVLISSSTTTLQWSQYYTMCIEALNGLHVHVVLSIGDHGDPAALAPLPPHFEVVQGKSHLSILRHSALIICQGGNITTSEALYHGVPLIVLSAGLAELEWQAETMVRNGFGIHLSSAETNSQSLRRSVEEILSVPKFRLRAERMMREVRRAPGAEEAVNRIEDYAHL